jgi:DNA-binding response OmpR family regulator
VNNIKILSLEDDANLSIVMSQYFEDEGYYFVEAKTGQECLEKIGSETFDILLMDLGLPDMDGLGLISQIKKHYNGPIIVVSGKSSTTDRIVGLEMGADDYIIKPFEMRELMARIKAHVRRQIKTVQTNINTEQETLIYHFDDFTFDEGKLHLEHSKTGFVDLTSGECQLLTLFLKSKGRALTREYLHEETRGNAYETFDRAVDIAVTRLRKKLNDNPSDPHLIKTIRGVGYIFVADIKKSPAN